MNALRLNLLFGLAWANVASAEADELSFGNSSALVFASVGFDRLFNGFRRPKMSRVRFLDDPFNRILTFVTQNNGIRLIFCSFFSFFFR